MAGEKVIILSVDRGLFGRLVIAAKSRDINLREVLSYELSRVSFSPDGSLRKTNIAELEKKVDA